MRVIAALFWGFLLINMSVYVISSMSGQAFDFATASIISVVFTLLVIILGEAGVPNEPVENHH
ncbi:DUF2929 domain-containing protein [Priestia aryabhattai]|uniref:YjzD family protein n=1 Tax=Bacillaceae TaxID=186817 RepID=UPI000BA05C27|nr:MULTISPECIES: YjzD family protein [Bacillaceae]MDT2048102.1 YjzD family protein [Priestia flexa]OZT11209.1 DUF2929 domain-containing protein [Priestia aryabhattai]TDB53225.1 DUF2929 family protein [Bacillus sp. CBEL-1]USY55809.1 YjzD family protein [Bacillus sp. 1780r2a1]